MLMPPTDAQEREVSLLETCILDLQTTGTVGFACRANPRERVVVRRVPDLETPRKEGVISTFLAAPYYPPDPPGFYRDHYRDCDSPIASQILRGESPLTMRFGDRQEDWPSISTRAISNKLDGGVAFGVWVLETEFEFKFYLEGIERAEVPADMPLSDDANAVRIGLMLVEPNAVVVHEGKPDIPFMQDILKTELDAYQEYLAGQSFSITVECNRGRATDEWVVEQKRHSRGVDAALRTAAALSGEVDLANLVQAQTMRTRPEQ